ncbi:MAG: flagellar basal body rod protein FlgC [Bdellovibrionales bacterium]
MINVLNNVVSGLQAQSTKLAVSASNIANADSRGSLDPDNIRQPYQALEVETVSQSTNAVNGGVRAIVLPKEPGAVVSYDPDSPLANTQGEIGIPNVNIGEELINNIQASQAYKASLQLIPVIKDMDEALFNAVDKNS